MPRTPLVRDFMRFRLKKRPSEVQRNAVVVFFPTWAAIDRDTRHWRVPVHGWIYDPKRDSLRRTAAIGLFRRYMRIDRHAAEKALFLERARLFVVDNARGQRLAVRLGERHYPLDPSRADGHMHGLIRVPVDEALQLACPSGASSGWLHYEAVTSADDPRQFRGGVQLLDDAGLSVVTDIDDTIKVSQVADRRALLRNTFLREFEAVPGMAELFAAWQAAGAAFHYVSASPWQLYAPLSAFCRASGFPHGSYHMRSFRVKLFRRRRRRARERLSQAAQIKQTAIEQLVSALPRRRFVLIGDSGQHDPEIYAELSRRHAEQIVQVLIRDVTDEPRDAARYRTAFAGVQSGRWHVFRDPADVEPWTRPPAACTGV